ncbi:FecR family protein [Sphingobacterium sp. LRF_L2]|uniref:FecR family protein n=1 Tax=Sphingobacterium sp. LRF_L2 TaxID=3369421 RepID=UPI003F603CCE
MDKKARFKKAFDVQEDETLSAAEKDILFERILSDVQRRRRFRYLTLLSAAAAILIVMLGFLFYPIFSSERLDLIAIAKKNELIFQGQDSIQLAEVNLKNNEIAVKQILQTEDIQHSAVMTANNGLTDHREYITLFIPEGKRQEFALPDGSTVWLNAGSYLTFASDMNGKAREVYLNGEGYFDVKHTGASFTVKTKYANVNVLGTTFNLAAYEEEEASTIDLLSGTVEFNSPQNLFTSVRMYPGQRVSFNREKAQLIVDKNSQGTDILWTKKQLAFDQVNFAELMRKLERIYNVKIIADKTLYGTDVRYSGRLNIDVDMISSLKSIYELTDYKFIQKNKEVYIIKR